jgi:hypothetical protein
VVLLEIVPRHRGGGAEAADCQRVDLQRGADDGVPRRAHAGRVWPLAEAPPVLCEVKRGGGVLIASRPSDKRICVLGLSAILRAQLGRLPPLFSQAQVIFRIAKSAKDVLDAEKAQRRSEGGGGGCNEDSCGSGGAGGARGGGGIGGAGD